MTETVRETKRADELKPGDWLYEDENGAPNPNEVKAVFQYPTKYGLRVHLTTQVPGAHPYSFEMLPLDSTYLLATEAEVAGLREQAERAQKIADIRALADWLEANPWLPIPDLDVNRQLRGTEGYRTVVELAERLGAKLDTHLDDRTKFVYTRGPLTYTLLTWHDGGRPADPAPESVDDLGDAFDRSQTADADETPVPVGSRRREPHAGRPLSGIASDGHPVKPGAPVDETVLVEHRHIGGSAGGPGQNSAECACGTTFDGFDSPGEANDQLYLHIEAVTSPTGLTRRADESRGPLAFTTPVVTYFSFGHGQSDPATGQGLLDHYVTVVAPTYEACREAMLASRFGQAWAFDYLAGTPRATEWIRRWTEHEVIVAPSADPEGAAAALKAARDLLVGA